MYSCNFLISQSYVTTFNVVTTLYVWWFSNCSKVAPINNDKQSCLKNCIETPCWIKSLIDLKLFQKQLMKLGITFKPSASSECGYDVWCICKCIYENSWKDSKCLCVIFSEKYFRFSYNATSLSNNAIRLLITSIELSRDESHLHLACFHLTDVFYLFY